MYGHPSMKRCQLVSKTVVNGVVVREQWSLCGTDCPHQKQRRRAAAHWLAAAMVATGITLLAVVSCAPAVPV